MIQQQVPASKLMSFGAEGLVETLFIAENPDELKAFIRENPSYQVLGKGSNTVFDPARLTGPLIKLGNHYAEPLVEGATLTVSAATSVTKLMNLCESAELAGLEFAAGVPASVGGMIAMNFGCWGAEVADRVSQVQAMDEKGSPLVFDRHDLAWGYRQSVFQGKPWIITEVSFALDPAEAKDIRALVKQNIQTRLEKQPLRGKTFGSTFKNPEGHFAGALIESVGLRGHDFGRVKWSDKHANFMENTGGATYQDVADAIVYTQNLVAEQKGVQLVCEVQLWPPL